MDCSLNGDCKSGVCLCDKAWSGSQIVIFLKYYQPVMRQDIIMLWKLRGVEMLSLLMVRIICLSLSLPILVPWVSSMIVRAEGASPNGPL